MDTEKARIFLSVINEGSLSATAVQLGYTTSGISRSIASLEEETGLTLFIRSKRGMDPTADAKLLVPMMKEIVYQAKRIKDTTERIHGVKTGILTIGISYAGYFKLIAEKLKAFSDKYPQIKIKTLQATSSELLNAIDNHEIDMAIMTYRESDYHFYKLRSDPMVAVVPTNHSRAKEEVFPVRAFETENFIAPYPNNDTDYKRSLEKLKVRPNVQFTTMDIYAAYCMVEAGFGCTLLNKLEVESWFGDVKIIPTCPEIVFDIGLLYPEKKNLSIAAKTFLGDICK